MPKFKIVKPEDFNSIGLKLESSKQLENSEKSIFYSIIAIIFSSYLAVRSLILIREINLLYV